MARMPRVISCEFLQNADERHKAQASFGARNVAKIVIAGFGRDWSRGIRNPALKISLQEVCPAQQPELLLSA